MKKNEKIIEYKKNISSIEWVKIIEKTLKDDNDIVALYDSLKCLKTWLHEIESFDIDNPALCFAREMQLSSQHAALLISLALYKPAAASMRSALENCLYYTYFRNHPIELQTQALPNKYYITKKDVLEFHKIHTIRFNEMQQTLGLLSELEETYSYLSQIVHGQIPGIWGKISSIREIDFNEDINKQAIATLEKTKNIIVNFLICTISTENWNSFSKDSKKMFLKGIPGDKKKSLSLDAS